MTPSATPADSRRDKPSGCPWASRWSFQGTREKRKRWKRMVSIYGNSAWKSEASGGGFRSAGGATGWCPCLYELLEGKGKKRKCFLSKLLAGEGKKRKCFLSITNEREELHFLKNVQLKKCFHESWKRNGLFFGVCRSGKDASERRAIGSCFLSSLRGCKALPKPARFARGVNVSVHGQC